jgi:IS30 family transposase
VGPLRYQSTTGLDADQIQEFVARIWQIIGTTDKCGRPPSLGLYRKVVLALILVRQNLNENTNGLLRQYFPKGTDLSIYSQAELDAVADELNNRPRETLGWKKPTEVLTKLLVESGDALRKWADLPIGQQTLTFFTSRTKWSSSFSRDVNVNSGEVLIAICEP